MEKILLAVDALNPSTSALDFACYLANLTNSKLTGIFLEDTGAAGWPDVYDPLDEPLIPRESDKAVLAYDEKLHIVERNIVLFKEACENRSVRHSVQRDYGNPANLMISNSRYADVLITDAAINFNDEYEGAPSEFVKELLKFAECPVIVAPDNFNGIEEILLTYDATKSAMYAVKQFTHLFPQLQDKKVTIVEIDEDESLSDAERNKFKEWISGHYSASGFEIRKGDSETELFAYLLQKKNVFIVMGAYGRNALSRFFKHSHADLIMKVITQAIFIAHP